jgi:hypothetical protein
MATKKHSKRQVKVIYTEEIKPRLTLPFVLLLVNKILNLMGFVDFIDRSVEWDPKHWTKLKIPLLELTQKLYLEKV